MSIYIGHSTFMNKIKGLKSTCAGLDLLDNMSVDSLAITLGTPHNIHVVAREPDLSERQITLRIFFIFIFFFVDLSKIYVAIFFFKNVTLPPGGLAVRSYRRFIRR